MTSRSFVYLVTEPSFPSLQFVAYPGAVAWRSTRAGRNGKLNGACQSPLLPQQPLPLLLPVSRPWQQEGTGKRGARSTCSSGEFVVQPRARWPCGPHGCCASFFFFFPLFKVSSSGEAGCFRAWQRMNLLYYPYQRGWFESGVHDPMFSPKAE